MDKDVLEGLLLTLAVVIICVLLGFCNTYCYIYWDEYDDDHRTHHREIKTSGINPCILRSIPVVAFNSRDFKHSVVCVVCLSDFADGDKAKVLPICNHWFHADCIDTWLLQSDSTCPICRNKVEEVQSHDPSYELPTSTDVSSGEAYELLRDATAVAIDIPAESQLERPLI